MKPLLSLPLLSIKGEAQSQPKSAEEALEEEIVKAAPVVDIKQSVHVVEKQEKDTDKWWGWSCFLTNIRVIILNNVHLFLLSKTEVSKLVAVLSTSNHTEVITNLLLLEVLLGEVLQINSNDSLQPSGISWRKQ